MGRLYVYNKTMQELTLIPMVLNLIKLLDNEVLIFMSNVNLQTQDLNVLDLTFFNTIQSLHYKEAQKNIDLLMAAEKAFEEFSPISLNHIFLTLR